MAEPKLIARPTFVTEDGRIVLSFSQLIKPVPGFSHRVILNGQPVGWLSESRKPNMTAARFFIAEKGPK